MKLAVSPGNIKLGDIPNLSLPPGVTCHSDAPCAKDCYAKTAWRLYPNSRSAWARNLELWVRDQESFKAQLFGYLADRHIRLFRWHVAGDIPDEDYLLMMRSTAFNFSSIRFLAFTKQLHHDFGDLPSNLVIVASMWPGWSPEMSKSSARLPRAYVYDKKVNNDIPSSALECFGRCSHCKDTLCWYLRNGTSVVFNKH